MLPLKDKTVLITRSAKQVEEFINQLQELGANTIALPLIENTAINQDELIEKVNKNNYDWLIFTSVNAVRFFFDSVLTDTISSKIAVVGNKTGELIREYGFEVDFTPSEFTAKHLANEIPIAANQRILIPRSNLAKNDIVEILESRNCNVEPFSIYENNPIQYSKEKLDEVFKQHIDYITFTSGSTIEAFSHFNIQLRDEQVICIGPETAKVAKQFKVRVDAIASPHTIEGLISAIINSN